MYNSAYNKIINQLTRDLNRYYPIDASIVEEKLSNNEEIFGKKYKILKKGDFLYPIAEFIYNKNRGIRESYEDVHYSVSSFFEQNSLIDFEEVLYKEDDFILVEVKNY